MKKSIDSVWKNLAKLNDSFLKLIREFESRIRLKKVTSGRVCLSKNDLVLFVCVRNELSRIPFFLEYYRKKGVDRFFFIDNNSNDGTGDFLLSQNDVYLFSTHQSYSNSSYGMNWLEFLLKRYGVNRWCLMVDIDEFLVYPHWEEASIKDLCVFLEYSKAEGIKVMILDMYADGFPLLTDEKNKVLWEIYKYFDLDKKSSYLRKSNTGILYGGVRKRVFNINVTLQKFPLIKYSKKMRFGTIHVVFNMRTSSIEGALFHFKFDSLFKEKARIEAEREEHWRKALEYKSYIKEFNEKSIFTMHSPEYSVEFENSQQLVKMKIIKTSEEFERYITNNFSQT